MPIITREELTTLITHDAGICLSMFMPVHRSGRELRQDPIRLKNLLTEAREQLTAAGTDGDNVEAILEPIESLRSNADFWSERQDGLAIFSAQDLFRVYQVPLTLPTGVHVNSRFRVRPIIQLLHGNTRFFVLALSQHNARLFEATQYSMHELDLESSLDQVRRPSRAPTDKPTLQFRTQSGVSGEHNAPIFHGHGGVADTTKQDIIKRFQVLDRAVCRLLHGEDAPLVLACVGYLASLYESTNSYRGLIAGKVPGSPEMWREDELRDRAWELALPVVNRRRNEALERFERAAGTTRAVSALRNIVLAANDGRIDTLFLERRRQIWGEVDLELRAVRVANHAATQKAGGEELLDFAAAHTLIHGGDVYSMNRDRLPSEDSAAAALLRF